MTFLLPRCTGLVLHSKALQRILAAFFQKFKKIVCYLRVNETRVTSGKAFIDNYFALESETESKNEKRTVF